MSATLDARSDLRTFFDHVAKTFSDEERQELLDYARDIEARRTGFYDMTEEEEAVIEAEAQEARGEIATEEELAEDRRRYGLLRLASLPGREPIGTRYSITWQPIRQPARGT